MPSILTKLWRDRGVRRYVASIVVDGSIGHRVGDDDLSGLGLELYGSHEVVSPRGERRVLGIGRFGVLPFRALPRSEPSVAEAGVSEVLAEVVDGGDAHLAGKSVVDLTKDVIFRLFDEELNIFCVHDENFLVFCFALKNKVVYLQQT